MAAKRVFLLPAIFLNKKERPVKKTDLILNDAALVSRQWLRCHAKGKAPSNEGAG